VSAGIFLLKKKGVELSEHLICFQIYATVAALVWTYLLSGILIDLLGFLGMLSKLNKTYLGLTIIAVGNALPDGVTTIALAK
jgi:Ca2+/Na+ antiporter